MISFEKDECIWTEISQTAKDQVSQIGADNGFIQTSEFMDSRFWFMDAIWTAV